MGNLLLGIWRDVLGRLRKSSSSSEPGTLPRWAWPTCFQIGRNAVTLPVTSVRAFEDRRSNGQAAAPLVAVAGFLENNAGVQRSREPLSQRERLPSEQLILMSDSLQRSVQPLRCFIRLLHLLHVESNCVL